MELTGSTCPPNTSSLRSENALQTVTPDAWKMIVADLAAGMTDREVADVLMRFQLLPAGPYADQATATVHRGSLTIDGDFLAPPKSSSFTAI